MKQRINDIKSGVKRNHDMELPFGSSDFVAGHPSKGFEDFSSWQQM